MFTHRWWRPGDRFCAGLLTESLGLLRLSAFGVVLPL